MPRMIELADERVASLAECADALAAAGFVPGDEESLLHAACQLRRLGNDPDFLGDAIVAELAGLHRAEDSAQAYGPQVMMLVPPGRGDFFIRANIWPSESDHMLRASGGASFVYGLPHDHNFDFLTLGYFGPGYWSDYYEFEYADVAGWSGEPVDLQPLGRKRLEPGMLMHYRAHRDVHAQLPADSLSVSLNIMHSHGAQGWLDQYRVDCGARRIGAVLNPGSSEAFVRIAVALGGAEARDLAERFALRHPSDRMRLAAWDALAADAASADSRDRLWRRAETSGSRMVVETARIRRAELESYSTAPASASIAP